jgi:hypothetical protein
VRNSRRQAIRIPLGSKVVLSTDASFGETAVVILPPGVASTNDVLRGAPKLSATVTHDLGVDWPDAAGCQLAQAAINDGGFVALVFPRERDAKACQRRLKASIPA